MSQLRARNGISSALIDEGPPADCSLDDHRYKLLCGNTGVRGEGVFDSSVVGRPDSGDAEGYAIRRLKGEDDKPYYRGGRSCKPL